MRRLEPRAKLDDILPFRDPDPGNAGLPHPNYRSDVSGAIPDGVAVDSVKIADYRREALKSLASKECAKPIGKRRLNLSDDQIDRAGSKIEIAVRVELERTIAGRKTKMPAHYVRMIGPRDVHPHESALSGQYGLFIRNGIPVERRPTLTNGKIIGLFAGAPLRSDPHRDTHISRLQNSADFDHYAVDIAKSYDSPAVTFSPMEGGNSMAFANTAILANTAGTANPRYDDGRINAIFVACDVTMIDKDGRRQQEQVAAIVGLDNLHGQVYLDYGTRYLEHFASRPKVHRSSERIADRKRQRDNEDVTDRAMTGHTAKRARLNLRARSRNEAR